MTNYKPCPFCGSRDVSLIRKLTVAKVHVECNNCHAQGEPFYYVQQPRADEVAADAWNTRAECD